MPDLDSGHYFLTTFAPIRNSGEGEMQHTSFTQAVRVALAKMPAALQSPATVKIGENSPFARNRRTHLARMFVLNDVVYNGRVGKNAIHASLSKDDPARAKPVERLNTSYLVFCADIDAVKEDGAPLPKDLTPEQHRQVRASYARQLWETMEDELREIYVNCVGFEDVETADDFARYLDRCHVETTMPFHDYYLKLPEFHRLPLKALLVAIGVPAVFTVLALLLRILGFLEMPWLGISSLLAFLGGAALTVGVVLLAIRMALKNGEKPLPPAEYDDLPSVLKALYLQQNFADFAVDAQGASPEELHARFAAFIAHHKPSDRAAPTQPPGVITSPSAEGATS